MLPPPPQRGERGGRRGEACRVCRWRKMNSPSVVRPQKALFPSLVPSQVTRTTSSHCERQRIAIRGTRRLRRGRRERMPLDESMKFWTSERKKSENELLSSDFPPSFSPFFSISDFLSLRVVTDDNSRKQKKSNFLFRYFLLSFLLSFPDKKRPRGARNENTKNMKLKRYMSCSLSSLCSLCLSLCLSLKIRTSC